MGLWIDCGCHFSKEPVVGCCERGNEHSVAVRGSGFIQ